MVETLDLEVMEETLSPILIQKGAVAYKRKAMGMDKIERRKLKNTNYWLKRRLEDRKISKSLRGYKVDRAARPEQPIDMSESYDDSDHSVTDNIIEHSKDIPVTANRLDSLIKKETIVHDEIISMFNIFSNAIPSESVVILPDPENMAFLKSDRNRLYGMSIVNEDYLKEIPL